MQEPEPYLIFIEKLNAMGAPYMVSGSVAASIYGEPRLTHDIDVILDIAEAQLPELLEMFTEEKFYLPPMDILKIENRKDTRGHFNIIHHATGFKADIYPIGCDPLHLWAMQHLQKSSIGSQTISVAPIEYVIIRKLEFFREGESGKHLRDIKSMIQTSRLLIDMETLEKFIQARGLQEVWQKAQQKY